MQSKTLAQLRQQLTDRFDEGTSLYIASDEANRLINEAAAHLHMWLSIQNPMYMYVERQLFASNGVVNYPLPEDFHRPIKVWCYGYDLKPLPLRDYNPQTGYGPPGYVLKGHSIYLQGLGQPGPIGYPAGLLLGYVPRYVDMLSDTDTVASSVAPGYDTYIVNLAVINAKVKEESVVADILAAQDKVEALIMQDILQRKLAEHSQIADVDPFSHQSERFW